MNYEETIDDVFSMSTFRKDDVEQNKLNVQYTHQKAVQDPLSLNDYEKQLLIDNGLDDFVRGGQTQAAGVDAALLAAPLVAKPGLLAGGVTAATNLIKKYPGKTLEVAATALGGVSEDPQDIALETTGFKADTMFVGGKPMNTGGLTRILDYVFSEAGSIFNRNNLVTPDGTVMMSKSDNPFSSSGKKPNLFNTPEKTEELNTYLQDALLHRQARLQEGTKQNLMKGFDRSIFNESNQEYILVKKNKLKDSKNVASNVNYDLKLKKDVEFEIIARSGFESKQDKDVKFMKMIVSELNKIEQQNPKLYLSTLMEYGDKAYLEHKVARRQFSWFWQRVEGNREGDNFGKWANATNRNTEGNLRLLLDPNYKTLKDTTEFRLKKFDNPSLPDEERLVITIEDPNEAVFSAKSLFVRSNPGNILIKKAGSGETVGVIPDFYRQIYSTQFAEAFKKNKSALSGPNVPEYLKVKATKDGFETITSYRDRVINKMIDDAISGKVSMLGYEERYLNELAEFYNLFTELESKTNKPWVRKPSWVDEILSGQNKFDDVMETDIQTFNIEDQTKPLRVITKEEELAAIRRDELIDLLKSIPKESEGRFRGRYFTSKRKEVADIRKEIKEIEEQFPGIGTGDETTGNIQGNILDE